MNSSISQVVQAISSKYSTFFTKLPSIVAKMKPTGYQFISGISKNKEKIVGASALTVLGVDNINQRRKIKKKDKEHREKMACAVVAVEDAFNISLASKEELKRVREELKKLKEEENTPINEKRNKAE